MLVRVVTPWRLTDDYNSVGRTCCVSSTMKLERQGNIENFVFTGSTVRSRSCVIQIQDYLLGNTMSFWSQTRMDTKCGKATVGITVCHNYQRSLPFPKYSFKAALLQRASSNHYIFCSPFLKLRYLWSEGLHKRAKFQFGWLLNK
jgi:hypothetical protein